MFSANATQQSGGYQISRSLRFNSADSAYLGRTPGSASNRTTWTWSAWVKRGDLSAATRGLFGAGSASSTDTGIYWTSGDKIDFFDRSGGSLTGYVTTNAVFRDPSAWYHIVVVFDSGNATAANRMLIYINNVSQSLTVNNTLPQNTQSAVNNTVGHNLGSLASASNYGNGYMTEVNFIDGQALTPSSFGEYNADTGVWQPKAYSGSYGTNGFYLNFSDNSNTTAATLGKDYSGNGNNWTPNNFSVAAGAGNDSLVDVPTNWGTDTGVGGTVRGNYCTLNAVRVPSSVTLSNGNLDVSTSNITEGATGTIAVASGKWYWETTFNTQTAGNYLITGIVDSATSNTFPTGSNGFGYYANTGNSYGNGTDKAYGATYTTGDIIGIALDIDNGKVWWSKNGTWQASGDPAAGTNAAYTTNIAGRSWMPSIGTGSGTVTASLNTGQRPFAYTAPSGFKALCTQNLPTPTVGATTATQAGKFFNPVLYTGTAATQTITGVGFQPDMVWIKRRDNADNNVVDDAVRGAGQALITNSTVAEQNYTSAFTAFASDGFTVTSSFSALNANAATYVAWNWKANGAGSSNTAGSITSTVSANTTSGFSIVTFTGTGASATVGHGLGVAPSMIITKPRNNADDWYVYHASLGPTLRLTLNSTSAAGGTVWDNTAPTSTVFSISGGGFPNGWTEVAYCFAEVPGYSKFGSYTGNGSSDGPFVYCGFRPKYVLVKQTDINRSWWVLDGARNPSNVMTYYLAPDSSGAENTFNVLDFTSNGFKWRDSSTGWNQNGGTYIFMAFAESPFKYSLAR